MADELVGSCQQAACNVAADGICLEQHDDVADCPYFAPVLPETNPPLVTVHDAAPDADYGDFAADGDMLAPGLDLFSGEDLVGDAVDEVMRSTLTRVVVIAGGPESGKTSLLACLYERFQQGPYASFLFAGSRTLPGFERRCFFARMASGRTSPTMQRTVRDDKLHFLHLSVRPTDMAAQAQDILFTDVQGEWFEAAQINSDEAAKLRPFQRADHFVLLFDCAKLVDRGRRANEKNSGSLLLESLLDASIIGAHSYVDVLFSKWDLVEGHQDAAECEGYVAFMRADLSDRFMSRLGRLRFLEIAAFPASDRLSLAYNIDRLFPS